MELTDGEQFVIDTLGLVYRYLLDIVGQGPTRDADLAELLAHIHAVQRYMMAQALCREFPDQYRALGEEIIPEVPPKSWEPPL